MSHRLAATGVGEMPGWVSGSLLVRRWRAIKAEVLDHKWYESERAGHDVGWDRAFVDWTLRHACDFDRRHPGPV